MACKSRSGFPGSTNGSVLKTNRFFRTIIGFFGKTFGFVRATEGCVHATFGWARATKGFVDATYGFERETGGARLKSGLKSVSQSVPNAFRAEKNAEKSRFHWRFHTSKKSSSFLEISASNSHNKMDDHSGLDRGNGGIANANPRSQRPRRNPLKNNIMNLNNKAIQRAELINEALLNTQTTGTAFGGVTYAEFSSGIAPSFEKRVAYDQSQMTSEGLRQEIENADITTAEYVVLYRDGIRSHPAHGPNSPLYVQCGYVADNQKRSGLTRRAADDPAPTGVMN